MGGLTAAPQASPLLPGPEVANAGSHEPTTETIGEMMQAMVFPVRGMAGSDGQVGWWTGSPARLGSPFS